jgi:hypothetical protein
MGPKFLFLLRMGRYGYLMIWNIMLIQKCKLTSVTIFLKNCFQNKKSLKFNFFIITHFHIRRHEKNKYAFFTLVLEFFCQSKFSKDWQKNSNTF